MTGTRGWPLSGALLTNRQKMRRASFGLAVELAMMNKNSTAPSGPRIFFSFLVISSE